jgi:hypothetical protein
VDILLKGISHRRCVIALFYFLEKVKKGRIIFLLCCQLKVKNESCKIKF